MPLLVEACCDSVATALAAEANGAGRIELCGPGHGGTTPSHGCIQYTRKLLQIPLAVMIRVRPGSFVVTNDELAVMCADIDAAKSLGADRIVTGVLLRDDTVDTSRMKEMVARAAPLPVTFHRAFDVIRNLDSALDTLMGLGVDSVLTSGGHEYAVDGAATLARLQRRAGTNLTIMAGGGVRAHNVRAIVTGAALHSVHACATDPAVFAALVAAAR